MRKTIVLASLAACCALFSRLEVRVAHAQAKPISPVLHMYYVGSPPETFDELFDKSAVVVDGVVRGEHAEDEVHRGPDPRQPPLAIVVLTSYDIAVREFFKKIGPTPYNVVIQMLLPGGRRDHGSFMQDDFDPRLPTPTLGDEYILFLRIATDPNGTWYMPTMALGESVFLVKDGKVASRGKGPVARAFDGQTVKRLQNALRRRGGKS